jgi:ribosomal protein S27E
MKVSGIIIALSYIGNLKCEKCGRSLITDDGDNTVVKKHLLKTYKKEGVIEVECRYCGKKNVIANCN